MAVSRIAGCEENHEILSQDVRCPGPNLNSGHPEYEAGVLRVA
jgi:hypothetical protein